MFPFMVHGTKYMLFGVNKIFIQLENVNLTVQTRTELRKIDLDIINCHSDVEIFIRK